LILLDAPGTLDSTWVHQELNRAHALSLGVLNLIWPGYDGSKGTEFCDPMPLDAADFEQTTGSPSALDRLTATKLIEVIGRAEDTRIRSLHQRRKSVIGEVVDQARHHRLDVKHYPQDVTKYPAGGIELLRQGSVVARVIPLVGLPDALAIHDHEGFLGTSSDWKQVRVTFNGLGMAPSWGKHLDWLNERERLVATQVDQLRDWMAKL
jgi:hypothetical protein